MKEYFCVVIIKNNVVDSIKIFKHAKPANEYFKEVIKDNFYSIFIDEKKKYCDMTEDELMDSYLEDGYFEGSIGSVCLTLIEIPD